MPLQVPLSEWKKVCSVCQQTDSWAPSLAWSWARPRGRWANPHLCLALMCICRPLRLEARCPHSSHTNSFSPRCLNASCSCSSVRDRKHLAQVGHCRAEGSGQRGQGQSQGEAARSPPPPPRPNTSHGKPQGRPSGAAPVPASESAGPSPRQGLALTAWGLGAPCSLIM